MMERLTRLEKQIQFIASFLPGEKDLRCYLDDHPEEDLLHTMNRLWPLIRKSMHDRGLIVGPPSPEEVLDYLEGLSGRHREYPGRP